MTITVPSQSGGTASFLTTVTSTLGNSGALQVGDTLVLLVAADCGTSNPPPSSQQTVQSMADSAGFTWTKRKAMTFNTTGGTVDTQYFDLEVWTAAVTSPQTSISYTLTFTGRQINIGAAVMVVRGLRDNTNPVDTNASATPTNQDLSGAVTAPNVLISTTEANDIIFLMGVNNSSGTPSITAGWTQVFATNINGGGADAQFGFLMQYKIVSAIQTGVTITEGTNEAYWGALAIALTADAGPPVVNRGFGAIVG